MTDTKGRLYEHMEYFPFGETWVEEDGNGSKLPYLFTSKELDTETGLYYYGARYYDPRTSVWQSTDPILGSYLDGKRGLGGIYNDLNLGLYSYGHQNPLKMVDPDGRVVAKAVKTGLEYAATKLTEQALKAARNRAVSAAWKEEQQLVRETGKGTRKWTAAEKKELLENGKVSGYQGHHVKNVADHPEDAGNPDNIAFVKSGDEHLAAHEGNYQNKTNGDLVDRTDGGKLPKLYSENGYSLKDQAGAVSAEALQIGVSILMFGASAAEVLDYLDPMTYATWDLNHPQEAGGALFGPGTPYPTKGDYLKSLKN